MVHRSNANNAEVMDAQIMLRMEECASGMVQSANDAAGKDAQIKLRKEEFARDMGKDKAMQQ